VGLSKTSTLASVAAPPPAPPAGSDLLERDFEPTRANQKWSADITYISTWEGCPHLAQNRRQAFAHRARMSWPPPELRGLRHRWHRAVRPLRALPESSAHATKVSGVLWLASR